MLEQLFEKIDSEILTDEVKLQMSTLFEAAVNEAIEAKEVALDEKNRTEITEFKDKLIEQVDEYMAYIVEEMTEENGEKIVEATEVATAKKIMASFEELATQFHLTTSDDAISESTKIDELKDELNEAVNKRALAEAGQISVEKKLVIMEKAHEFETDTAKEKFLSLAESVEFVDAETFAGKLAVIAESVKPATLSEEEQLKLDEAAKSGSKSEEELIAEAKQKELDESSPMAKHLSYFK